MTYQVTVKKSELKKMSNRGIDVKSQLKLSVGGIGGAAGQDFSSDKSKLESQYEMKCEKETLVIGGRPPGDVSDPAAMAAWADTVEELPMPVSIHSFRLYR